MKKILVLFAVLLVAFMVFACGQTTTTAPAVTTPAATTTAKTTVATTVATTEATTTVATTAPITPGDVYVDLDFDAEEGTMVDKMGNVTLKPHNDKAFVDSVTITHNSITKDGVSALTITEKNSWVECTFNNLADAAQLNKFVEEMKGWTVEAFYLNTDKKNVVGIVCVTEGNVKEYGKQGWGLADNAGNPYFIFGDGTNNWSTTGKAGVTSATEFCHVVAVYDATAKTNTVYLNGKAIKSVEAKGFVAAQATSKDGFVMGNGFFLGADPTISTSAACDYPASDLAIAEVKIYAGALTAAQALEAYKTTAADFQNEVIEDGKKIVAYVPAGKTDTAVNLASGLPVGALTLPAETEITLKDATLYLVEAKEGKLVVLKELGAAVEAKKTTMGWTNLSTKGAIALKYSSYWMKETGAAMATYKYNNLNTSALNTAMGDDAATVGKFGTLTFNAINQDSFSVYFDGDKENVDFITDYKVNFVYVNYDGSALRNAKGSTWTPLAFNKVALRYAACDVALDQEIGTAQALWQEAMRTYGGYPSVKTMDDKWNGETVQNYNCNAFKATSIPSQYDSALSNYLLSTTKAGKTEAQIKSDLEAANAALAAAQKAFDDAVAANATVKGLKDAMDAALTALNTQKQVYYVANEAYQNDYYNTKTENQATLKATADAEKAKQTELQTAYDNAKKAYDDAVAADATLKALNAELVVDSTARNNITNNTPENNDGVFVSKATLQAAANTRQTRVDAYKKWAPLYEKFMAAYEAAANVALWTPAMVEAGDFSESPLYKAFKDIPAKSSDNKDNIAYPTYTYYYDVATQTYTIFVTSCTQASTVEKFDKTTTNNSAQKLSGSNWLYEAKLPEVAE